MSSWRIREIENEIDDLERKLCNCSEKERYNIRKNIDSLKLELRRLQLLPLGQLVSQNTT